MRAAPSVLLLLTACPEPIVVEDEPWTDGITSDRLMGHLETLEAIADAQDGNRVYLSAGYQDSVDYIASTLEEAGFTVTIAPFDIRAFAVAAAELTVLGEPDDDVPIEVFEHSGSGTVEAEFVAVDVVVPPPDVGNSSTSGCETSDFDGFPEGAIAVIQRGSCPFVEKVAHAEAAGAAAVVLFNEGQPGRTDVFAGSLDGGASIPVVATSYANGASLVAGGQGRLVVDATTTVVEEHNVFAEIAGDPTRVVMVGAHLDSVEAGPGINDNGSGSALVLELALQMAERDVAPRNTVRFAWWGAEEQGLFGSSAYFLGESGDGDDDVLSSLDAYLNFDMVASGNGGRYIYDGDGSDFDADLSTPGSADIETLFAAWFDAHGLGYGPEGLLLPTDSYWTALLGVPTGGLFSGAFEPKTDEEEAMFGGTDGEAHDACYHQACDRVDGVDPVLYEELGRAAAHVLGALADREEPMEGGTRRAGQRPAARPRSCHGELVWSE